MHLRSLGIGALLLAGAALPQAPPQRAFQFSCWQNAPPSLIQLCLGADAIVVGKVLRVTRAAHTPYNAFEPNQHTVFEVQVIRSLKHPEQTAPESYLVRQNQGDLPWQSGNSTGVGLRIEGEPMLRIGERYLFFLKDVYDGNPRIRAQGYGVSTVGGVTGRSGEYGELQFAASGTGAQWLISGGRIAVPKEEGREPFPDWTFRSGAPTTVLGLTEAEAVRVIEDRLADIREGRIG